MTSYTISFLGPDNEVVAEELRWFEHDDKALDEVGWSNHPHAIRVYRGLRMVAHVPALPQGPPP